MEPEDAVAAGGLVWAEDAASRFIRTAARHSNTVWNRTGFNPRQGVKGATWLQRRCDEMMTAGLISDENGVEVTPRNGFGPERQGPANRAMRAASLARN